MTISHQHFFHLRQIKHHFEVKLSRGKYRVAQESCQFSHSVVGVCKQYKDCAGLKDRIIYPDYNCKPGTICCPDIEGQPTESKLKAVTISEPTTTTPIVTQIPIVTVTPSPPPPPAVEIPSSLDKEFYRRLGLTFGERYDIYHNENNTTQKQVVSTQIPTTTTTAPDPPSTTEFFINFDDILHPLGLEILRSQKCGFIYASEKPNASNVQADILEFPWMALLQYNDTSDGGRKQFVCGGSLVTERWVLTAAECIKPGLIGVRLGEYKISANTKKDCTHGKGMKTCTFYMDFKISTTVIHQDYEEKTGFKNIALIKLRTRAGRSKNIKPICLPTQMKSIRVPYDQNIVKIAGWGLAENGFSFNSLKKHIISQRPPSACKLAYPNIEANRSRICLGVSDEQGSICSGDPGGPIFWLEKDEPQFYTQIGIVPFDMNKCGAEEDGPYYAESVADSMDWITKVIGESK